MGKQTSFFLKKNQNKTKQSSSRSGSRDFWRRSGDGNPWETRFKYTRAVASADLGICCGFLTTYATLGESLEGRAPPGPCRRSPRRTGPAGRPRRTERSLLTAESPQRRHGPNQCPRPGGGLLAGEAARRGSCAGGHPRRRRGGGGVPC